jgi:predicted DNA-binding transcriptional regulator YafY
MLAADDRVGENPRKPNSSARSTAGRAAASSDEPDGSLTVRFEASGWLEMAWHLCQWGDRVEVLEPEGLRDLLARHQRADFPALP